MLAGHINCPEELRLLTRRSALACEGSSTVPRKREHNAECAPGVSVISLVWSRPTSQRRQCQWREQPAALFDRLPLRDRLGLKPGEPLRFERGAAVPQRLQRPPQAAFALNADGERFDCAKEGRITAWPIPDVLKQHAAELSCQSFDGTRRESPLSEKASDDLPLVLKFLVESPEECAFARPFVSSTQPGDDPGGGV
jgi:hypothetical protein